MHNNSTVRNDHVFLRTTFDSSELLMEDGILLYGFRGNFSAQLFMQIDTHACLRNIPNIVDSLEVNGLKICYTKSSFMPPFPLCFRMYFKHN